MHLQERVVAKERDGERGVGGKEARVRHLLDGLADAEDDGGVGEGDDNVLVELLLLRRAHRPHRAGVRGELGNSHLSHSQTVAEGAEGGAGPAAAETVDLRGLLAGEIEDLGVENWRERVDVVDEEEVLERARLEVRDHDRLALDLDLDVDEVRVVAALDREELVQRVVGKLRRHEQEARLQNHQRLRHRHRVEVADVDL
mmetsp:Transcript_59303/g.139658  ORF Transcript_59303/g.139658 Transcript_59303/m.139658 type:complete len:200 (-) Transcript_59303:1172-1771(-)